MTATTQDERIASYLESCGPAHRHEGYGFYWLTLEIVASQLKSGTQKCSVTYPLTTWSRLLYCHHHTVRKYFDKMAAAGLITIGVPAGYPGVTSPATLCSTDGVTGEVTGGVTLRYQGSSIEVIIPKLLKYRDEYSRKSGHSPDNVPPRTDIEQNREETDKEPPTPTAPNGACSNGHAPKQSRKRKDKRTTEEVRAALGPERLVWWENFWEVFPCHDGINEGINAFELRVKDHELAVAVWKGAKSYRAKCDADPTIKVKFAQGWINSERWLDENNLPAIVPRPAQRSFVDDVQRLVVDRISKGEQPW